MQSTSSATITRPAPTNGTAKNAAAARQAATGLLLGIVVPLAGYYGLRAAGVSDLWALIVSTVPPTVHAVVEAVRHRRINPLDLLILIAMVLSLVVGMISGSPRELLVRNAWISAPLSLWTLASLWFARPVTYTTTRTVLPHRAAVMDRLWDEDPGFRQAWRQVTVAWGLVMLIDAGIRVVMAMTLPIPVVPVLDVVVSIGSVAALQVPTHVVLHRSGHWRELFAPGRRGFRSGPAVSP